MAKVGEYIDGKDAYGQEVVYVVVERGNCETVRREDSDRYEWVVTALWEMPEGDGWCARPVTLYNSMNKPYALAWNREWVYALREENTQPVYVPAPTRLHSDYRGRGRVI